ncbi:hypothetical protein LINGRAHAP2_LOCUS31708, partial [Linum grandiflorum]
KSPTLNSNSNSVSLPLFKSSLPATPSPCSVLSPAVHLPPTSQLSPAIHLPSPAISVTAVATPSVAIRRK